MYGLDEAATPHPSRSRPSSIGSGSSSLGSSSIDLAAPSSALARSLIGSIGLVKRLSLGSLGSNCARTVPNAGAAAKIAHRLLIDSPATPQQAATFVYFPKKLNMLRGGTNAPENFRLDEASAADARLAT